MPYVFRSTVSRGDSKGAPMTAHRDGDGNFVLLDPRKRRGGSVLQSDYRLTRSSDEAARLIQNENYSMRMVPTGFKAGPSMVRAQRIEVIRS